MAIRRPRAPGPSPSSFRARIHALERQLFLANQKQINAAVEGLTEELARYEARYHRTVFGDLRASSLAELVRATRRARVILVGDYHTLRQSQRSFYRLLRRQPPGAREVVVALEMLPAGRQAEIDAYLAGGGALAELQARLEHERRWPHLSLEPLEPLFELCRARGWQVIGLDPTQPGRTSLAERDHFAAERVARALEDRPRARAFILMGELHLAPGHLPKAVADALRRRAEPGAVLRVHQNPERVWFEETGRGLADEHDVLAFADGAFALLSATPLVCQQSFLTWLDRVDNGEPDETESWELSDSGERIFRQSASLLGRALDLPIRGALDSVEVVGPADLSFFERLAGSGDFTRREVAQIRAQILASESYYVPRARLVYLATLSVNHAAEEASHFLRHHFSGEGIDDPRGMVDAFYSRVLNEAIGFFGSKIVNPKRKCPDEAELASLAAQGRAEAEKRALSPRGGRRSPRPRLASTGGHGPAPRLGPGDEAAARFVVAHREMERGRHVPWLTEVFHTGPDLFNEVTHLLGYLLGERLYYGLVRGVLGKEEARQLYLEPIEDEGAPMMLYFELAAKVGALTVPERA